MSPRLRFAQSALLPASGRQPAQEREPAQVELYSRAEAAVPAAPEEVRPRPLLEALGPAPQQGVELPRQLAEEAAAVAEAVVRLLPPLLRTHQPRPRSRGK